MKDLSRGRALPFSLAGLVVLLGALEWLVPPEETLGPAIKLVLLHGALVQAGLLAFAAAGLLGLACLLSARAALADWCLAVQETGAILWVLYALSSMAVTYLTWGVAIAWGEPRVQAGVLVLGACLLFLLLALWVRQRAFTGLVNVAMALVAWGLVKHANLLRHPLDPIGNSPSAAFKLSFLAIQVVVVLLGLAVACWLERRRARPAQVGP